MQGFNDPTERDEYKPYGNYMNIPVTTPPPPPPPKKSRIILVMSLCLCIASSVFLIVAFTLVRQGSTQASQQIVKTQQVIQKQTIILTPTPTLQQHYTALQILSQMTGVGNFSHCIINNATGFSTCEAFNINGTTGNQDNILLVYPSVQAAQQAYIWHTTNSQSDSANVFQHNLCLLVILPVAGVQYQTFQVLSVVQQLDNLCA